MPEKISVVINTFNEEKNINQAIESIKWADEIIVCDMHSSDNTTEVAKALGAKVFQYQTLDFVEPARNFAISKATGDWVLILDSDEEVSIGLKEKLIQISSEINEISYVKIPRKNIIFGKWIKSSGWWPDYNIRFFKKGTVVWSNKIHRPPETKGKGIELEAKEELAILHHHYRSLDEYLERMIRYTKVQSKELIKEGYIFDYSDLIRKPLSEFLSRFFAQKGYQEGVHGLALSLLQAISFLIVYLRVWEFQKFKAEDINLHQLTKLKNDSSKEINYWFKIGVLSKNPIKRFLQKVKNKANF